MSQTMIGRVINNRYQVEAFIASGGMKTVYKVRDLERSVPLAMKVLHTDLEEDVTVLRSFKRESAAIQKLTHPNIVRFYGLERVENSFFGLEEFIDGPTLKDILNEHKTLSILETLIFFKALSAALGFAHAKGVIHCDVKPSNVMIDAGGKILLTDFGVSRHSGSTITSSFAGAGTPAYMSPEQVRGEPVSPASDIYALGIMLFEMLTGRRPFLGTDNNLHSVASTQTERIRYAHLKTAPPNPHEINPEIPVALGKVILTALNKDPGVRYSNTTEFFEAATNTLGIDPASIRNRILFEQVSKQDVLESQMVKQTQSSKEYPKEQRKIRLPLISVILFGLFLYFSFQIIKNWLLIPLIRENLKKFFSQQIDLSIIYGLGFLLLAFVSVKILVQYRQKLIIEKIPSSTRKPYHIFKEPKNENNATEITIGDFAKSNKLDVVIPLRPDFPILLGQTSDAEAGLFFGRDTEFKKFIYHLSHSKGKSFLVSGYRGVGKTLFVTRAIENHKKLLVQNTNSPEKDFVVDVHIPIPKAISSQDMLSQIVTCVYDRLEFYNLVNLLNKNLQRQLQIALQRTQGVLEHSFSTSIRQDANIGVEVDIANLMSKFRKENGKEENIKYFPLNEMEVISLLRKLHTTKLKRKTSFKALFQQSNILSLKLVIVFDELDRIEEPNILENVISSLKTLFTTSGVIFIFVTGKDLYNQWLIDSQRANSKLEGVFSGLDIYLPCLWNVAEKYLEEALPSNLNNLNIQLLKNEYTNTLENFKKYLAFRGRGLPRRLSKTIMKYIFPDEEKCYLGFSSKNYNQFKFYAELYDWIEITRYELFPNHEELNEADYDTLRMCLYCIVDWIIQNLRHPMKAKEIFEGIKNHEDFLDFDAYLDKDLIIKLLLRMDSFGLVEKSNEQYCLSNQKYTDVDSLIEATLLPRKNHNL